MPSGGRCLLCRLGWALGRGLAEVLFFQKENPLEGGTVAQCEESHTLDAQNWLAQNKMPAKCVHHQLYYDGFF
jgi:hypothetical protein